MSFFDRCVKAVTAVKKLQNTMSNIEPNTSAQHNRASTPTHSAPTAKADFPELLSRQFPGYEVYQNLCVSQVVPGFSSGSVWYCRCGGRNEQLFCSNCGKKRPPRACNTRYINISYALYQNGQPKLAILLIPSAAWNDCDVVSTMAACQSAGIPCQRYFEEFSNREDYVTNRIRETL